VTLFERAQAVSEVLRRIRVTRAMDRANWTEIAKLEGELAELLDGVTAASAPDPQSRTATTPASYWR
jgi:hypothetical protein